MNLETVGNWLLTLLIFGVQGLMVYGIGRLLYVGGGIEIPNPFQPGWSTLFATYGLEKGIHCLETISTSIGAVTHRDTAGIRFEEQHLLLSIGVHHPKTARIPYPDIQLIKEPGENTVLRIKVRTDGVFTMGGVKVSLQNKEARQLMARLAQPATQ